MSLSSCSGKDDEEDTNPNSGGTQSTTAMIAIDRDDVTPYDMSLLNARSRSVSMMSMDDDGNIENMDCMSDDTDTKVNITFYDNGLVKSIGGDSITFVFSNYDGNLVDIAIMYKDDMRYVKGYICDINWDDYVVSEDAHPQDSVWYKTAREAALTGYLYNVATSLSTMLKQLTKVVQEAYTGTATVTEEVEIRNIVRQELNEWLSITNLNITQNTTINTVNVTEVTQNMTEINTWYNLYSLINNYSSFTYFSQIYYNTFVQLVQEWNITNVNLGLSTLNTGSGDLKATLSWNFYADIDLHAIEPDGSHIYWYNPTAPSGGFLDVDNRDGGNGATENIYWRNPENGTYTFYLHYYGFSTYNGNTDSGMCKVTIMYRGQGRVYNIPMVNVDDEAEITEVSLPLGTYTKGVTNEAPKVKLVIDRTKRKS